MCTIHVCLLYQGFQVDFNVVSLCPACTEHIWDLTVQCQSAAKCDKYCELLEQCPQESPKVVASQSHRVSSTVDTVLSCDNKKCVINIFDQTHFKSGSVASVTIYGMSGTEGPEPAGTYQLICSCQEGQLAAVECRQQSKRHHSRRHQ